jgi:hypothetical protein
MDLVEIRRNMEDFGASHALYDLLIRAVNKAATLKILKGVKIERADPQYLKCPPGYKLERLDALALRRFATEETYGLSAQFLDEALAKGDACYALLDGGNLASYGWYSNKPTRIDPAELLLHFSRHYIYMYKGFTHADYRGRRLHAIGMTCALQDYLRRGFRGILSYVESNNFASLKSVYRMGYTDFGKIYIARLAGRYLLHCDAGCRAYGFRVELARAQRPERQEAA